MSGQAWLAAADADDLAPLQQFLQSMLGIRFDGNRGVHLVGALTQAVARSGAASTRAYLERVRRDPAARERLLALATVGETYFFRHPEQLEILAERVIPELLAQRGAGHRLKLWSAGCATGEEPYSLAMLAEDMGLSTATVLGTDVSRMALRRAATATYGRRSLRGPDAQPHRLEAVGDRFRVPRQIAERVQLRPLNLLHDSYPQDVDVILCRNVLMYLSPEHIRVVGERLTHALAPGGWLITAPADPEIDFQGQLEPVLTRAGVMYRRMRDASAPAVGRDAGTVHRGPRDIPSPRAAAPRHTPHGAMSALRRGDHTGADATARGVVAGGEDSAQMRVVRARTLGNTGRIEEGETVAAEGVGAFPLDAELRSLHAELLLEGGRAVAAAEEANAAIYLDPELASAYLVLGRAELARGRGEAARRAFQQANALFKAQPGAPSAAELAGYAALYQQLATEGGGS